MKKYSTILNSGVSVGMIVALLSGVPAYADIKAACDSYTGDVKTACESGYGGTQCSTLTGDKQVACDAGQAQAKKDNATTGSGSSSQSASGKCGGAKTELVSCKEDAGLGAIASLIKIAISVVTTIVGIVAVGGIAYAAILYASARDNQGQVHEAIVIIRNVIIGIVMYALSIAIMNWLIPGGVIG